MNNLYLVAAQQCPAVAHHWLWGQLSVVCMNEQVNEKLWSACVNNSGDLHRASRRHDVHVPGPAGWSDTYQVLTRWQLVVHRRPKGQFKTSCRNRDLIFIVSSHYHCVCCNRSTCTCDVARHCINDDLRQDQWIVNTCINALCKLSCMSHHLVVLTCCQLFELVNCSSSFCFAELIS